MTILTSSFYAILQYYNNHHAHIEHTHYNIEQKFSQVFIRKQFSLTTVTQFLKAKGAIKFLLIILLSFG